jgi:predicted MFS family arabinose efflux permease
LTNETSYKSLIASITIPNFAATISNTVLTLLLIEIAVSFFGNSSPASIAKAGQLSTINSLAEAAIAVAMGFLVIRFRHKALYLSGVFIVIVSAIGNFFAPTLLWMQAFYFLEGLGSMIVLIIATTLVGDLLPTKQKGKAISYIIASIFLVSFAFPPLISYIAGSEGWRYNFLLFVFPAAVVGLVIVLYGVPIHAKGEKSNTSIVGSFRKVLSNRSATACLLCQFFLVGASVALFTLPFFVSQFGLPREDRVYILMTASGIYVLSGLVTGRLVNRLKSKNLVIMGALFDGIFITALFLAPSLWTSLAFNFVHVWFAGMALASFPCLVLDQIPTSRGTMVSLSRAFSKAGDALTPALGGLLLLMFSSYSLLGATLGTLSIIGAIVVLAFVHNPTVP